MATYLLLHGGGAGSWMWKYCIELLRDRGHDVHTVTFTGCAERRHLASRDCTTETHVADVLNAIEFGDIGHCILVAHSYAGAVVPGIVDSAAAHIRRIVYLDGLVVRQGESVAEAMGLMSTDQARRTAAGVLTGAISIYSDIAEQQRAEAERKPLRMSAERQEWLLSRICSMPAISLVGPVAVGAESIARPVDYIAVSDTVMKPMHERARQLGWTVQLVEGDHAMLVGDPQTTVRLLDEFA